MSFVHYVGIGAKAIRSKDNTLYVFATNSTTTRGEVGARLFFGLDTEDQEIVMNFIALEYGAEYCYIYSMDSMQEVIEECDLQDCEIVRFIDAPYNFGK